MSQENVEVVRRGFAAWNAGDMDALRELYDPEVSWRPAEDWPEPGRNGRIIAIEFFRDHAEALEALGLSG